MSKKNNSFDVLSYGCSANFGEGEMIAGLLEQEGFAATNTGQIPDESQQHISVMNLCTVKGNQSALKEVRRIAAERPGTHFIFTGCVTKELSEELQKIPGVHSITSTHGLKHIPQIAKQLQEGHSTIDLARTKDTKVNLPRKSYNPVVGIIPVSSGCLDQCSFCSTRLVKGKLYSFSKADVVADAQAQIKAGAQELWITGQDSACWGFDTGEGDLADLLQAILDEVPGNYFLRVGMGNPRHLKPYIDKLIRVMEDPRVYRFIHLPVQAGSNEVLQGMKRRHSVEDYLELVEIMRNRFNDLTLSTDIIVGFPNEREEQFVKTLEVVEKTRPSVCNRTRFVARKGTLAAQMPGQLSKKEKKDRSRRLTELFKQTALENNQEWEGWEGEVLLNEAGKDGSWLGRNYAYKQIAIRPDEVKRLERKGIELHLGKRVQLRLLKAHSFYLEAEYID